MGSPFLRTSRRRGLRWVATGVLAALAGLVAATSVHRAEQLRTAYGSVRTVPVAVADLPPGTVVAEADVEWRELPVAVVPDGSAEAPVGRTVADDVAAGEVVLERRLGGGAGPLALVEPGRRAVAVPTDGSPTPLTTGDRVDVYAPTALATGGARRVAAEAVVVSVDERSATLSVAAGEASAVAQAALDGAVVLAVVAPG